MNNPWTWEEIRTDWLAGSQLAFSSEEILAAFHRAEQILGREWIEDSRIHSGVQVRGTWPTLHVVATGQMLASLAGVSGAEELIEKLRVGDESAFAELTAVHLIRSGESAVMIELGPSVQVRERSRKPDFRVRRDGEQWTYVEVTKPDVAEAQMRSEAILNRLADLVRPIKMISYDPSKRVLPWKCSCGASQLTSKSTRSPRSFRNSVSWRIVNRGPCLTLRY